MDTDFFSQIDRLTADGSVMRLARLSAELLAFDMGDIDAVEIPIEGTTSTYSCMPDELETQQWRAEVNERLLAKCGLQKIRDYIFDRTLLQLLESRGILIFAGSEDQ